MRICIFEDNKVTNFLPLAYFRPVFDLRCGSLTLLEKLSRQLPSPVISLQVRDFLAECCTEDHPGIPVNGNETAEWYINGRVIADGNFIKLLKKKSSGSVVLRNGNNIVALRSTNSNTDIFANGILNEESIAGLPNEEVSCSIADYPWDLVHHTSDQVESDFKIIAKKTKKKIYGKIYPGASLLNRKNIIIGRGSVLKPGVVLDAEHGSIIIGKNVTVMPNAVIIGPAYIGDGSIIKVGAKIYHGTSIGERCKVGGEVEASIIQSYSNKQHDGFLGHSYLGSWVNLGADTNTSDLKNTYGNVRVELHGKQIDTGYQFVGLMMGDHSKTGINVMFDTGTIVEVSCNIFGANLPPKNIPSFSWGQKNSFSVYDIEKSIETARKVMKRRDITMTAAYEKLMRNVFLQTENDRRAGGVA